MQLKKTLPVTALQTVQLLHFVSPNLAEHSFDEATLALSTESVRNAPPVIIEMMLAPGEMQKGIRSGTIKLKIVTFLMQISTKTGRPPVRRFSRPSLKKTPGTPQRTFGGTTQIGFAASQPTLRDGGRILLVQEQEARGKVLLNALSMRFWQAPRNNNSRCLEAGSSSASTNAGRLDRRPIFSVSPRNALADASNTRGKA